ncbi:hypothetical protein CVT24_005462 [Panaeolus cyanescens]|uniref:Uncharacterized protein n=1 Tax=Panaeolus cyanescens TaxID=181874 RepID=A0A409WY67_9AGAR|nr:hypothetical protein CVT24_005462 [Panaeolus cyanescens]
MSTRTRSWAITRTKPIRREVTTRRKKTTAEKEAGKEARREQREAISAAIEEARQELWEKALELRERFPKHTAKWYHSAILQASSRRHRQQMSRWRAFVSKEVKRRNEEAATTAAASGEPVHRIKATDISTELAEEWREMSAEDKIEATEEYIQEMSNASSAKTHVANPHIVQFHDVRANCQAIHEECIRLAQRCHVEIMFTIVRTELSQYNKPYVFATSERLAAFFNTLYKTSLSDMVIRMESFMIAGPDGLSQNYSQTIITLKSEIAALIHQKLDEAAGYHVSKMIYTNFDSRITLQHGILLKGWPLKNFCSPSDVTNRADLLLLKHAWLSGTAKFEKMSKEAYKAYCEMVCRHAAEVQATDAAKTLATLAAIDNDSSSDAPMSPSLDTVNNSDAPTSPSLDTANISDAPTSLSHDATNILNAPTSLSPGSTTPTPPTLLPAQLSVSSEIPPVSEPAPLSLNITNISNTSNSARTRGTKRKAADPFISMTYVSAPDGSAVAIRKKPRKARAKKNQGKEN